MTSRIPHLLEPYLSLPPEEASLTVLTSVLGASTNWLVLRHLHALLKPSPRRQPANKEETAAGGGEGGEAAGADADADADVAVLLVSFLRDLAFWRDNLSRLGVDLEAAARRGRFGYVDGLAAGDAPLFFDPEAAAVVGGAGVPSQQQQRRQQAGQVWKSEAAALASPADLGRVISSGVEQLRYTGRAVPDPAGGVRKEERKVVLVIDGLDFVLAAMDPSMKLGPSPDAPWTALGVKDMLMELREKTHAAIVTLAADDPLIKEQETTLEKQHAWFALSLAHEADAVLSLRLLDTGAAKDVSGVIRITHREGRTEDHEYLYQVGGDGGVRVFERGQ